jgi:excisionase family DNA binding protein
MKIQESQIRSTEEFPRWLSIKQLANYLGRSVQSIRKDVREKRLPATRIGGQIKFDKRDIDQLLEARKIVSVEQLIDEANPTTDDLVRKERDHDNR